MTISMHALSEAMTLLSGRQTCDISRHHEKSRFEARSPENIEQTRSKTREIEISLRNRYIYLVLMHGIIEQAIDHAREETSGVSQKGKKSSVFTA
ncbi:hypothetical protein VTN96DRAFT_9525 [Rasamsonia emersonii]